MNTEGDKKLPIDYIIAVRSKLLRAFTDETMLQTNQGNLGGNFQITETTIYNKREEAFNIYYEHLRDNTYVLDVIEDIREMSSKKD